MAHHNETVVQARQLAAEEERALQVKKRQLEEELRKAQELYRGMLCCGMLLYGNMLYGMILYGVKND